MNTRKVALASALSLLAMAVLAPFAQFGVLQTLIVPADAAATARNLAGSASLFAAAIAAFFAVAILDVVVGWAAYVLFRPIDAARARLVGWARVVYAAGFAYALTHLVRAAQLAGGIPAGGSPSPEVATQVASATATFQGAWDVALLVFGLHLVGLGMLVMRSADFPRILGVLVAVAGAGYLVDAVGRLFVPGYALTVSQITFIGEALLIAWLFKLAIRGSRTSGAGLVEGPPAPHSSRNRAGRSPVPAIIGSTAAGAALALALVIGPASGGSEPVVTGSVMFAFGLGWGLMWLLTARFSGQPQPWMRVPALGLGATGLVLIVTQPGPAAMDLMSWIWPAMLAGLAIWMIAQVRRGLRGAGRWIVATLAAVLVLIAVAGGPTAFGSSVTVAVASPAGQVVDVGGRGLYLECSGEGGPVVILEAGLWMSSSSWARITPSVAAATRVCAYDRAGHGQSDDAPGPQDGIDLANDLHTLLERAGIAGPYVLVGHSSGGAYVRAFAARYPADVAGMVLLDAQPADAFTALPDYPGMYQTMRRVAVLSPSLARVGLLGPLLALPAGESTVRAARVARDEILALPSALQQAAELTTIDDRPLLVITAGSDQQAGWLAAQDRLPGLSTNSVHRVVTMATHNSLITGDDVRTSIDAILAVVVVIRTATPLE